jgi:hypothetical protein
MGSPVLGDRRDAARAFVSAGASRGRTTLSGGTTALPVGLLGRILHASDGILHLADSFGGFAFDDHFLIADGFADFLLGAARNSLGGAGYAVLIH